MAISSDNPYASPSPPVEAVTADFSGPLPIASRKRRFLNLIIDYIVTTVISTFAIGMVYILFLRHPTAMLEESRPMWMEVLDFSIAIGVTIAYYILMEGMFQRTLAKFITGTQVVQEDGRRPTYWQILGRTLARYIPFEPFSFLADPVGWHDSLSGTRVIRVRP